MEREAFRQRMQQYKQARESNPQLKYWDWKKYVDGGTVDEDPPSTSERPIINFDPKGDPYKPQYGYNPSAGFTQDPFNLYDAPILGDILSIGDAGKAAYNKDWLGASLAALGVVPFVPGSVGKKMSNYIPTVTRSAEAKINALLKKQKNKPVYEGGLNRMAYEDAIDARNRVYESVIDPENLRRARAIDKRYGTSYEEIYKGMHDQYENPMEYFQKIYEPVLDTQLPVNTRAQINVAKGDNKIKLSKDISEGYDKVDEGLIRHEIGHKVDAQATNGQMLTNPFMKDLVKDILPYEQARYMLNGIDDPLSKYNYLTRPSEVKSHMNQFRQYLIDNKIMKPSDRVQDVPNFFMHLQAAPDEYKGIKLLQNLFKSDNAFKRRFDQIPLTNVSDNRVVA